MGQAEVASDLPNTFAVPTKLKPCKGSQAYMHDGHFDLINKAMIDEAISYIPRDKPIIPFPKIGRGWSHLNLECPKTYAYLKDQINMIKYPLIEYYEPNGSTYIPPELR